MTEEIDWEFTCDRCGKHNQCSFAEGKSAKMCWCNFESRSVDASWYDQDKCLCPACWRELEDEQIKEKQMLWHAVKADRSSSTK